MAKRLAYKETMHLDCPHCGEPIPLNMLAKAMGEKGGSQTSPAKKRSSALNGKLGGRPPKKGKKKR